MNDVGAVPPLERMIRQQIVERGISDEPVLAAMRAVPREAFVPAELRAHAYADQPLPIGHEQTISQPYMVALMTRHMTLQPAHRVLEIGTGCGYQTAILAKLSHEVWTIERIKPLLDEAWERLMSMGVRNVHFRYGDGNAGWRQAAPFDRILIAAAARTLPRKLLLEQLVDGGQAVLPVGDAEMQMLLQVTRRGAELETVKLGACRFVDFVGTIE
jgi:protein-L-isoaspartate(D-aspartate) O-methyltransferase